MPFRRNFAPVGSERRSAKKDVVDVVIPQRKFSAGLIESTDTTLVAGFSSSPTFVRSSSPCGHGAGREFRCPPPKRREGAVISDDNEAEIREGSISRQRFSPFLLFSR